MNWLTAGKVYNVATNFLMNWTLLSVTRKVRILYGTIQYSKKGFDMCVDVYLNLDTERVNLELQYVITRMY